MGDCEELYFWDDHIDLSKKYEKLKLELYNRYKPNRDLYTEGKKLFVKKIVVKPIKIDTNSL